ncbi:GroES-like protein [Lentinus brumalis]|uniref:GroES-like protein n=1 Tax=Lentinus brumalis TaxID=2498619 RepID=A0A371D2U3_9APHY|nr:GroES-like protein [Polyporus brumalis]
MSPVIPSTMKALVIEDDPRRVEVKDHPVPSIADDEILVKTVAVSQNPTDFKHVDWVHIGRRGSVLGCDFSGIVVKVGKNVTSRKVGDRVSGFVHGGAWPDEGAFAEYLRTPAELVWPVPDSLKHEEAATLNCAFWTAVQALFHSTRLGLVEPPEKAKNSEWVLIYGGSSSVGQCAVQLAHLAGYKVVSTASPRNHELVKSLGADTVFDYRDPEVVSKIKQATGDAVKHVLDTISEGDSQRISAESLGPQGGKVIVLLKPQPEATSRKDVKLQHTLLYTVLGREFDYGPGADYPVAPEDRAHMVQFLKKIPKFIEDGSIKPLKVRLWEGGLNAIPEGLQYMREGKVSAEKIVYRI